jgi:hypothetical protein
MPAKKAIGSFKSKNNLKKKGFNIFLRKEMLELD